MEQQNLPVVLPARRVAGYKALVGYKRVVRKRNMAGDMVRAVAAMPGVFTLSGLCAAVTGFPEYAGGYYYLLRNGSLQWDRPGNGRDRRLILGSIGEDKVANPRAGALPPAV